MNSHIKKIHKLRKTYHGVTLSEGNLAKDPIKQFIKWFNENSKVSNDEPNSMTLSTSNKKGRPSSRQVLLKGVDKSGFRFFTNYESRKGVELRENPYASLLFYWPELMRQVRVEGKVTRLSKADSQSYFATRPRGSQIAAWASAQSRVVGTTKDLEARVAHFEAAFPGKVEYPPFWGGYIVTPQVIEFWSGRPNRLHERIRYTKKQRGGWKVERLDP